MTFMAGGCVVEFSVRKRQHSKGKRSVERRAPQHHVLPSEKSIKHIIGMQYWVPLGVGCLKRHVLWGGEGGT